MSEPAAPATPQTAYVTSQVLEAIMARHGFQGRTVVPLMKKSAGNSIYMLGDDLVLRIPHEQASNEYGVEVSHIAISAARAAGVRTPKMLVFDDSRDLVPVPFAIVERVHGEPLSKQEHEPSKIAGVWQELGHDLAALHHGVHKDGPAGELRSLDMYIDPRPWLDTVAGEGLVSPVQARWLLRWLDEFEPLVCTGEPTAFCHGDVNGDNVLVSPGALDYLAIIDWDGAGWTDPVWDFVPLPLRAVPLVLQGYREVSGVPGDDTAEARIVWHHIQYTIFIWWKKRDQGRGMVEQGMQRLRSGIAQLL